MVFSFAAAPPAHAFVGIAALSVIIVATFASSVLVKEIVVKQKNEPIAEHSASKQKTPHKMQASNEP